MKEINPIWKEFLDKLNEACLFTKKTNFELIKSKNFLSSSIKNIQKSRKHIDKIKELNKSIKEG